MPDLRQARGRGLKTVLFRTLPGCRPEPLAVEFLRHPGESPKTTRTPISGTWQGRDKNRENNPMHPKRRSRSRHSCSAAFGRDYRSDFRRLAPALGASPCSPKRAMPGMLIRRLRRGGATRSRGRSVVDRTGAPDYKPALPPLAPGPAQVAQLVEHATENRSVGGSIPPLGTTFQSSVNKPLRD